MKNRIALQYSNTFYLTNINVMKIAKKLAKNGNFNLYQNQ